MSLLGAFVANFVLALCEIAILFFASLTHRDFLPWGG